MGVPPGSSVRRRSRRDDAAPMVELLYDGDDGGLALKLSLSGRARAPTPSPQHGKGDGHATVKGDSSSWDLALKGGQSLALVSVSPWAATAPLCPPEACELLQRLQQRPRVAQQLDQGGEPLSVAAAVRWLRSKGWDVDAAEEAVAAHAEWRCKYVPAGRILEEEIPNELAAEKVYLQGADKDGHAVVVVAARRHDMAKRDLQETERLICYTLDTSVQACDSAVNPLGKIVCLFDLAGLSMRNLDIKSLGSLFELLKAHYPERLAGLWFLNAPLLFWGAWNCIAPFVDPCTRQKIHFSSASPSGAPAALAAAVPPCVLPSQYGGAAPLVPIQRAVQQLRQQQAEEEQGQARVGGGGHGAGGGSSREQQGEARNGGGGPWWSRARRSIAGAARAAGSFVAGPVQRRLREALAATDKLQPLQTLRRVPSSRHLQIVAGRLQLAAGHLNLRLLDRVVELVVPQVGNCWLAVVRGLHVARRVLRWTFGTY